MRTASSSFATAAIRFVLRGSLCSVASVGLGVDALVKVCPAVHNDDVTALTFVAVVGLSWSRARVCETEDAVWWRRSRYAMNVKMYISLVMENGRDVELAAGAVRLR